MTIEWLEPRRIAISRLKMAGNFRQRLKSPHVADRKRSIAKLGLLHRPIVRAESMKVICGNDRIAALVLSGEGAVECDLVRCSDEDAAEIEKAENYQRRHNAEEQALIMKAAVRDYSTDDAKLPTNRKVAQALLGRLPSSVERGVRRSKAKDKRETIRMFGMEVDDDWYREAQACLRLLLSAEKKVRAAASVIGRLKAPYPKGRIGRLQVASRELAAELKAGIPSMLCPHCKNIEGIKEKCVGCQAAGFITRGQEKGVPKALINSDEIVVQYRGEMMPLSRWMAEYGPEGENCNAGPGPNSDYADETNEEDLF
jgi:ParB-like chromosome segregation protein Spo0J